MESVTSFSPPVSDTAIGRVFAEQGYYIAKSVYSPEELVAMEADFDRIVQQLTESGENINAAWSGPEVDRIGATGQVVLHTHNVQHYSAVWMRALLQEKFLSAASDILGSDIVLHHTKLFQKPPEVGAPFPMHQDWNYFPSVKDTMMAGIIHVSEATDEMGCLRVYPGSHRLGRVPETWGSQENSVLEQYPLENALPLEAEPGDVVFFHYFTIHGSMPNRSRKTRKTVLVQLHSGTDAMELGFAHPYEQLTLSGWNYAMTRNAADVAK
jgi:ectoine hydroxylase-related dioxygenase (phytanoyl-CoA dioxygenase family)